MHSYCCSGANPLLCRHLKLIVGSSLLFLAGSALMAFGTYSLVDYSDKRASAVILQCAFAGYNGWIFLFAGLLCFIPGAYHLGYILCALSGRNGFNIDELRSAY